MFVFKLEQYISTGSLIVLMFKCLIMQSLLEDVISVVSALFHCSA